MAKKSPPDSIVSQAKSIRRHDPLRMLSIRLLAKAKRERQHKAHSVPSKSTSAERLNRKRSVRTKTRNYINDITGNSRYHAPIDKKILISKYRDNNIIETLWPQRKSKWKPILKRNQGSALVKSIVVDRFSFIDDPIHAFNKIIEFAKAEAEALDVFVDFTMEHCEDLGPFLLLAEIWPSFAPVFRGGMMMHSVQKVIEAVGLRGPLGLKFPHLRDLEGVWALPVQRRRPSGSSRSLTRDLDPQSREEAAGRICDQIDQWLDASDTGCLLGSAARGNLTSLIGEILDNAERHSSFADKDGSWSVAACMTRRVVDGKPRHLCYLSFFSAGDTISESLEATAPIKLREQIAGYVVPHSSGLGKKHSRETLLTVAAIQDGVTRDADAFGADSGGTGFMEFVESVHRLAVSPHSSDQTKIVIVSGKSCVTIRHPYDKGHLAGSGARLLFFNEGNTKSEPPDKAFVYDLPVKLQGTVISVAFTLDSEFLREAVYERDKSSASNEGQGHDS